MKKEIEQWIKSNLPAMVDRNTNRLIMYIMKQKRESFSMGITLGRSGGEEQLKGIEDYMEMLNTK